MFSLPETNKYRKWGDYKNYSVVVLYFESFNDANAKNCPANISSPFIKENFYFPTAANVLYDQTLSKIARSASSTVIN